MNILQNRTNAQVNLVPNWSFENNIAPYDSMVGGCLLASGGINMGLVPPWDSPSYGSPDPFDTCAPQFSAAGVPNSIYGYQHPKSGHGYVGLAPFYIDDTREYIQVQLDSPLVASKRYCAVFYINRSAYFNIACNNFGIYFSNTHVSVSSGYSLSFTPQINYTSVISDTLNWTLVSGEYIAHGGEQYIIIGNFYNNANTHIDTVSSGTAFQYSGAYYFIDDVSLIDCTTEGIAEVVKDDRISIYPNPSEGIFNIAGLDIKIKNIKVFDTLGRIVYETSLANENNRIDMSKEAKGMYFVSVQTEKEVLNKKIVIE
jgi:hypothetical protein